jgi:hypothetical protein
LVLSDLTSRSSVRSKAVSGGNVEPGAGSLRVHASLLSSTAPALVGRAAASWRGKVSSLSRVILLSLAPGGVRECERAHPWFDRPPSPYPSRKSRFQVREEHPLPEGGYLRRRPTEFLSGLRELQAPCVLEHPHKGQPISLRDSNLPPFMEGGVLTYGPLMVESRVQAAETSRPVAIGRSPPHVHLTTIYDYRR